MDVILEDDNENRASAVLDNEIIDHFAQVDPAEQEFKVD